MMTSLVLCIICFEFELPNMTFVVYLMIYQGFRRIMSLEMHACMSVGCGACTQCYIISGHNALLHVDNNICNQDIAVIRILQHNPNLDKQPDLHHPIIPFGQKNPPRCDIV